MPSCIDLHSHSHHSDGTLSPEALVDLAANNGVKVLALTDHDTTAGVKAAQKRAEQIEGFHLLAGVEVSAIWQDCEIHITGINIDVNHPSLQAGLAEHQQWRLERAQAIANKLDALGVKDVWQSVQPEVEGGSITRAHFARVLIAQGYAKDMNSAFKYYLGRSGKAYVAAQFNPIKNVIAWINEAGGAAVLAHPLRYRLSTKELKQLINSFAYQGGQGVEIITSATKPSQSAKMYRLIEPHGLKASLGSDFHGPKMNYITLGRLPELPKDYRAIFDSWDISKHLL